MSRNFNHDKMSCSPRRLSSRDIAHQSALDATRSQYGTAVIERNPMAIKKLDLTVKNLERNRRCREQEYFWKQRQFFLEKAFDENNEIRFAKLNQKIINNLKKDAKAQIQQCPQRYKDGDNTSPGTNASASRRNSLYDTSLTGRFFPVIHLPEQERLKSANYALISEKKKKFRATVKANQAALAFLQIRQRRLLERKGRNICSDDDSGNEANSLRARLKTKSTSPFHDDVFLPENVEAKEKSVKKSNPVLFPLKCNSANFRKREKKRKSASKMGSEMAEPYEQRDTYFENRNSLERKQICCRKNIALNKSHGSTSSQSSTKGSHEENVASLFKNILTITSDNDTKPDAKEKERNVFIRNKSDDLLIRLSKTLPTHMLLKSNDALQSVSDALGFTERNRKYLQREKTLSESSALQDERFKKLQSTLVKS